MDVAVLENEIERLPEAQQDRLAAFLLALRMRREGTSDSIQQRLNDTRPENWIPWNKVKSDLGIDTTESDG